MKAGRPPVGRPRTRAREWAYGLVGGFAWAVAMGAVAIYGATRR